MKTSFIDRLSSAVRHCDVRDAASLELIGRAIADTLSVAAAGFLAPVTRNALSAYSGNSVSTWSGELCESAEAAVMINAIASHPLDCPSSKNLRQVIGLRIGGSGPSWV